MTDRIPLDDLTRDALDQLYIRLDAARRTVDRFDAQAQQHKQRADQAEATLDRVRALADRWDRDLPDHVRFLAVAALRFALDPDQQPTTPAVHLPDGGNAEDCDACRASDTPPPYPWICPGPNTEQQPTA
ncbi:hypothetical protein OHR86_22490 [Streptomyces sp. NBC_00441]|uniref:hypothetical protein n=1 Tax=Streptomyces sp. NBC_00441 TaxID=2975742 RepID=UPI002E2971A4|nr:hypothetical protein [Streptomyces sp. NBC_00441]